ncbi:drug/metabolite transporter (DMT)-like permease [Saccharothrix coeruleofusca]|uniref:DMT family transporter n=1 Tax=Saccharothrix coeruleofusca TaxID=33919 RepID=UPI001AEAF812|nr:DMT family transporter [Saccharothrix coeruleofusca]MBP2336716.1 drug/metabolite transporter (DMT)-like permease [Saccharothrix coeruleofusca]
MTAWQLLADGGVLIVPALVVEGAPPTLTPGGLLGFGYLCAVATALGFTAWFTGLRHLGTGAVGLIGLLNPVTGVLLGTLLAGEALTGRRHLGLALVLVGVLLGQPAVARRIAPPSWTPEGVGGR